jgi:hypothetical protein
MALSAPEERGPLSGQVHPSSGHGAAPRDSGVEDSAALHQSAGMVPSNLGAFSELAGFLPEGGRSSLETARPAFGPSSCCSVA